MTIAKNVLYFNENLSHQLINVPDGFEIINPFNNKDKDDVKKITEIFYQKYYNDNNYRYIILGSSPARRGTSITGIPFEDAEHLMLETGVKIKNFYISKPSSNFLYDVIIQYGGFQKFYSKFYMNFVCPLGIIKKNLNNNWVNCNYYENNELKKSLYNFIIDSIYKQINIGINTSKCYCIGSGANYNFLLNINEKYRFFDTIIPLEHPRFIMQYNLKNKELFIEKYLKAFYK